MSIKSIFNYLRKDIWHLDKSDNKHKKMFFVNIIKAFMLTYRNVNVSMLMTRASALTYSTLLSIIPLLAVLFGIASGFGFKDVVAKQISTFFAGQEQILERSMAYSEKSIEYAHEGIFIGIGLLLLFYTVISLLMDIENAFNSIWGVKGRSLYRMFTDYLALIIILPVFLVANAGLNIFLSSVDFGFISFVATPFLQITPFLLTIVSFTLMFIYIPNTKVKLSAALCGGIFTGVVFQIFQMFYISGQIWIVKYNAIYGSFAILPLLLLWLQITWVFILVGLRLSFSFQNIFLFSYEYEIKNISNRYRDFVLLMCTSLIVKKFVAGEPCTDEDISQTFKIPSKLNSDSLSYLQKVGLIEQVVNDNSTTAYVPSTDVSKISVSYFFKKINTYGTEDFPIDIVDEYKEQWKFMSELSDYEQLESGKILLKDFNNKIIIEENK